MDLDLWSEDLFLAQEWGLDLPTGQSDGLLGDLKPAGRLDGGFEQSVQVLGVVEEPVADTEDALGMEFMESSDLSVFLDALDNTAIPVVMGEDASLQVSASSIDSTKTDIFQGSSPVTMPVKQEQLSTPSLGVSIHVEPISPAQSLEEVTPVIKFEPIDFLDGLSLGTVDSLPFNPEDLISRPTDLPTVSLPEMPLSPEVNVTSPFSSEGESNLSSAGPSSPVSSTGGSSFLIETSPELYKIITNTRTEKPRFSPYQTEKPKKKTKAVSKRKPAEPVPEYVIMDSLNKKDRKKLQNKNAAIRYRMKKKEEANLIKSEEEELEEINEGLKSKVDDLEREIRYIKNLMEDVYKAKGIIS